MPIGVRLARPRCAVRPANSSLLMIAGSIPPRGRAVMLVGRVEYADALERLRRPLGRDAGKGSVVAPADTRSVAALDPELDLLGLPASLASTPRLLALAGKARFPGRLAQRARDRSEKGPSTDGQWITRSADAATTKG